MGLILGKAKVLMTATEYQSNLFEFTRDTVNSFSLIKTYIPEKRELITLKYPLKSPRNYYIDYHCSKNDEERFKIVDGVLPEEILKELDGFDDIGDIITMYDDEDEV